MIRCTRELKPYQNNKIAHIDYIENTDGIVMDIIRKKFNKVLKIESFLSKKRINSLKEMGSFRVKRSPIKRLFQSTKSALFVIDDLMLLKDFSFILQSLNKLHISVKAMHSLQTNTVFEFFKYGINSKIKALRLSFEFVPVFPDKIIKLFHKKYDLSHFEIKYPKSNDIISNDLKLASEIFRMKYFKQKLYDLRLDSLLARSLFIRMGKHLEHLELKIYTVQNQAIKGIELIENLKKLRKIKSLSLEFHFEDETINPIISKFSVAMREFRHLSKLNVQISGNYDDINHDFFYMFQDLKLKELIITLRKIKLTNDHIEILSNALLINMSLQTIGFDVNNIQTKNLNFEKFGHWISKLRKLRSLRLSISIFDEEESNLFKKLNQINNLHHLELELMLLWKKSSELKDLEILFQNLSVLNYLRLSINGNLIHEKYAIEFSLCIPIFEMIGKIQSLTYFSLTIGKFRKSFSRKSEFIVSKMISSLKNLKSFSFKSGKEYLSDIEMDNIAKSMTHLHSLSNLSLNLNIIELSSRTIEKFCEAIPKIKKLDYFDIRIEGNPEQQSDIRKFTNCLQAFRDYKVRTY